MNVLPKRSWNEVEGEGTALDAGRAAGNHR